MVAIDRFHRSSDDSPPVIIPSNSLRLRILRITPLVTGICADFRLSPHVFSRFYEQGGGMRPL